MADPRHHVVIVGSGFGGLFAAQKLKRADVDITLDLAYHAPPVPAAALPGGDWRPVDRRDRPVHPRGAAPPAQRHHVARRCHRRRPRPADRDVAGARPGDRHVVRQPDPGDRRRTVVLRQRPVLQLRPGHEEHRRRTRAAGPDLRRLRDRRAARPIREDVKLLQTFVVVGAGPTGVEMAGQIAELAHRSLVHEYRNIDTRKSRIILIDGAPAILPTFGEKLGAKAAARLTKMGVEIKTNAMVTDVDIDGITGEVRRRARGADRGGLQDLGGRCLGEPARPRWSASSPAPRSTGPAGSRYSPTSPCPGTPRCSWSAT